MFDRLVRVHGNLLVNHALGYLTVAKFGLTGTVIGYPSSLRHGTKHKAFIISLQRERSCATFLDFTSGQVYGFECVLC